MSAIDEGIVREYFEQNGFMVRQPRKYQVQARRKTGGEEVDLVVFNPSWQRGTRKPGFFLFSNELPFVRQAVVAVKGWHTGVFTPTMLKSSPEIFGFLQENVLKDMSRFFPSAAPDDAAMTVWALTALLVAVGRQGRFEDALAHGRRAAALAAGSRDTRSLPLNPKLFLGLTLFDCDLVDEARAAFRAALDDEFDSGWWLSDALMADAQVSFVIGDWEDADPALLAGGRAAQEKDRQLLVAQSLAYRTLIATGRGDLVSAAELAAGITPSLGDREASYNEGILAFAFAELEEARGNARGAYDVLLRCWRIDGERENRYYHRWLAPGLVRLGLALGHRDTAAEVATVVAGGVRLAPNVPTVRSLALRCQGLVAGDAGPLIEAVAQARQAPLLLEHAEACEDAASMLARQGRRGDASDLLAEALARYEQAGADAWARRVRMALRGLGVHPAPRGSRDRPASGWESLTRTEQAVSRLVAEGLTNGAVARRLYISPHTVNTHLRHVFTKLDVPNRVALAAVVHRSTE